MSKIISIGTAVPHFRHHQTAILDFMQRVYCFNEAEKRKLRFLYAQSQIDFRYSVIPDYSRPTSEWKFYPRTENLDPFPSLEQRMEWYNKYAAPLSVNAIRNCMGERKSADITHVITVSCTGMSAPGLDLQLIELLELPKQTFRTSVNFMGCYAAIHALKMADSICKSAPEAKVLIVCTELCTLHFQRDATIDNIASSLLFSDGSAAALIVHDDHPARGLALKGFYSEILVKGKKDMAWEMSSSGFLMTLSTYIADLIKEDFGSLVARALINLKINQSAITHWCIHPGGRKILEAIHRCLEFTDGELSASYKVMRQFGNMSSPTILFVLKDMFDGLRNHAKSEPSSIFTAAFGPGLTMETFVASY